MATAQNQYVILYPGASNSSTALYPYLPISGGLLASPAINTLPPGTFQIIPMPDGTKYYLIANGGTPIAKMDSNFQNVTQIGGNITLAPTTAALTPDGRKLVVGAGTSIYVIDTTSDAVITQAGIPVSGKPVDIAINIDSSRAYVLTTSGSGSQTGTVVTAIDLTAVVPAITLTPLTLPNDTTSPANGLALAPSGFLYLANNYRIFEINPVTMKVTTNGELQVQAYPGKPYITPDGKFLVASNLRPVQGGTMLIQVNLASHVTSSFPNVNSDIIDRFYSKGLDPGGSDILYAVSTSGSLYDVTLGSAPNVTSSALNNIFPVQQTFSGVQFSNEFPPKLMWVTYSLNNTNYLEQIDIVGQTFTQVPIPTGNYKLGTLSVAPSSGGTTLVGFNNNQTVTGGTQSALPIVARLIDPQGRGIYRGQITFTTANPGVLIATPNFVTGTGGLASTYVTLPTTPGTYTVTANGGPGVNPLDFTFTVPGTTGGGGGATLGGLFYVSGNGQLTRESFPLTAPLTVKSLDASGNPVSNAVITWTLAANGGSGQYTNSTDGKGQAYLYLNGISGVSGSNQPYIQTPVQATDTAGNTVNFIFTTVPSTLPDGSLAPDPTVSENLLDTDGSQIIQFPNGRVINATAGTTVKNAYYASVAVTAGPYAGTGIQNIGITFSTTDPNNVDQTPVAAQTGPSAQCIGNPLTDARGVVVCDLLVGNQVGTGRIFPNIGNFKNMTGITLNVKPGPPSKITINSGDAQSGKPGDSLSIPLSVKVTDAGGNVPATPVTITWSTILGSAVLSATSTPTDSNGNARITVKLGSTAGQVKIQASVSKDLFVQFNETVNVVAASLTAVSGDNQSAFTNSAFANPFVVVLKDVNGTPLPNTTVTFSATGGATVNPQSTTTGTDGTASTRITAGTLTGQVVVTANSSGFSTSISNLTVKLTGPQITSSSFVNGAAPSLQGLTPCGLGLITGTGIAPGVNGTIQPTGFGPNPTSLGPVQSLTIGGIAAPLTSVSNINGVERVGFQTPCELPVGSTSVTMNVSGGVTTVGGVPVVAYLPGMFESIASDGLSYATALRADGSFVGPLNAPVRGETIRVFVTGLGQTAPAIKTNSAGVGGQSVIANVIGGVNNAGVLVVKAEYVAGQIGVYFVDIVIPLDTTPGPYQPIAVAIQPPGGGDLIFGNGVFVPIQP